MSLRILYLSPWFPYPPEHGSKIRIFNLLQSLSPQHEIRLLSFVQNGEHIDSSGLENICSHIETVPSFEFSPRRLKSVINFFSFKPRSINATYSSEMAAQIEETVKQWKPNVIIASEMGAAIHLKPEINVPHIYEDVELGLLQQNWSKYTSPVYKLRRRINWTKVQHYVKKLVKSFDACTVVSENERVLLQKVAPNYDQIYLIPNGADIKTLRPNLASPRANTLIFNGALTYQANYDAMSYFLSEIFPLIQARIPDTALQITGSFKGVDLSNLPLNKRITMTGFIQDIRQNVAGAWACVVPLLTGGGTRLKILEAMALGTPVVATTKAAEGLAVTNGQDILIADGAVEFADQVLRLLEDPDLRSIISKNGRQLVENHYGWETIGQKFEEVVKMVVDFRRDKTGKFLNKSLM